MVGESAPPDCAVFRAVGTVGPPGGIPGAERHSPFVPLAAAGRPWLVAQSVEEEPLRGSSVLDRCHVEAFVHPLWQGELVGLLQAARQRGRFRSGLILTGSVHAEKSGKRGRPEITAHRGLFMTPQRGDGALIGTPPCRLCPGDVRWALAGLRRQEVVAAARVAPERLRALTAVRRARSGRPLRSARMSRSDRPGSSGHARSPQPRPPVRRARWHKDATGVRSP